MASNLNPSKFWYNLLYPYPCLQYYQAVNCSSQVFCFLLLCFSNGKWDILATIVDMVKQERHVFDIMLCDNKVFIESYFDTQYLGERCDTRCQHMCWEKYQICNAMGYQCELRYYPYLLFFVQCDSLIIIIIS